MILSSILSFHSAYPSVLPNLYCDLTCSCKNLKINSITVSVYLKVDNCFTLMCVLTDCFYIDYYGNLLLLKFLTTYTTKMPAEVGCCTKYFLFFFNVLFWVRLRFYFIDAL